MNQKFINESNRLIAEFMDVSSIYHLVQLHYHDDWNWLMAVIQKIENMDYYWTRLIGDMSIDTDEGDVIVSYSGDNNDIDALYRLVVKFIKWYNQNIKNND